MARELVRDSAGEVFMFADADGTLRPAYREVNNDLLEPRGTGDGSDDL